MIQEHGQNCTCDECVFPPIKDSTKQMTWDYCPSCAGELDTGFECNSCGRDWRPWATLYLNVVETEGQQ